jgi:hypothetical protein
MNEDRELNRDSLERLLGPTGEEVSCEECFELELSGADADAKIPGLRAHLEGCSACKQDHESLRALVAEEPARE